MRATPPDHDDIIYPGSIPFVLAHLACLGAIWTGVPASAVAIAVALYVIRMVAATAGYHRYFSHRSYRTSRAGQFLLALLAQSAAQRGVLWWAAKHRHHHRHSDTEHDVHSPRQRGFWYAHFVTGDDSRNNFWLALITMGEGWHNHHHAYQRSTRQGFRWWEVDLTFYILTVLSWLRIVWDLGTPPPDLVRNERPLGRGTIEKVAQQVATTFSAEQMAREVLTERVSLCLLQMDDLAPA
jgi:fatty-acid desaturase